MMHILRVVLIDIPRITVSRFDYPLEDNLAEQRIYNCESCNKSYNREGNLRRHIKFECGKEPKFQCSFCLYKFKRKEHLKKHCKSVEVNGKIIETCKSAYRYN
ncbi:probable transcription repressor protein RGM1 [Photinus pyralis]|uniref:probable transcription repressor protein RGM1 n=1 Tax=Photinus pyralis TaxID=7054 RepID=UPI001267266E|nr:probable transcription repressor protein RGM1 [Photinus pyralis]